MGWNLYELWRSVYRFFHGEIWFAKQSRLPFLILCFDCSKPRRSFLLSSTSVRSPSKFTKCILHLTLVIVGPCCRLNISLDSFARKDEVNLYTHSWIMCVLVIFSTFAIMSAFLDHVGRLFSVSFVFQALNLVDLGAIVPWYITLLLQVCFPCPTNVRDPLVPYLIARKDRLCSHITSLSCLAELKPPTPASHCSHHLLDLSFRVHLAERWWWWFRRSACNPFDKSVSYFAHWEIQ